MTIGVGLVVSGCTADEPETSSSQSTSPTSETRAAEATAGAGAGGLRSAPEVGDPMPASVFANVPEDRGLEADQYEFLYRTGDGSVEYYRGPVGGMTGSGADNVCLTEVFSSSESIEAQCSSDDFVGSSTYVDGVLVGGAGLSQSPPEDDLPWSSPVEGFWVIDLSSEQ